MCKICGNKENYIKNICKKCYEEYPSTFDKKIQLKKIYVLECQKHGKYLAHQSNVKCPTCYSYDVFCSFCGKKLSYKTTLEDLENNHYCCPTCRNRHTIQKLTEPGYCTNPNCGKYAKERDAVGHCLDCSRKQLKEHYESGFCCNCGKYNKIRDNNGRGRDVTNGEGYWITENDILNENGIIIVHNGEECGCDCSQKWYLKHNNNPIMLEHSSKIGLEIGRFNLINGGIEIRTCKESCLETPHKYNKKTKEWECQHCSGEKVWCNHCQQWERVSYNSKPYHWIYWASLTKKWILENKELCNFLERKIKNFDELLNYKSQIYGIYGWYINNVCVYIGESANILDRSYWHMMNICEFPEYWYNVINHLENNVIEVRIIEEVDRNKKEYINLTSEEFKKNVLKPLELKYINKLKPDSQKCDGKTDNIIDINLRRFKINL